MDDHIRKQIEEILKHIDEQPTHAVQESQERIVHVYMMDGGGHKGGRTTGRPCTTALFPLPRKILYVIGVGIFISCISLIFSLLPVVITTTTTIAPASATITIQQSTLGPAGVALLIGGMALLIGLFILKGKGTSSHD